MLSGSGTSLATSFFDQFIDPNDGKLDASQWLAGRTGFLPVPIVISDPAVGYGGGLALAFFHDAGEEPSSGDDPNARISLPPSVSVAVAAYTENDSWIVGGGHIASWKNDSIRYTGLLGYADMNLKFYGVESGSNPEDRGFGFNVQGAFLLQELLFRVKESDVFLGGRYSYLGTEIEFNSVVSIPGAPRLALDSSTGGLGLLLRYDTRDSIISPDRGVYAKFEPMFYNEAFGGDFNYTKTKLSAVSYWPVSNVVLGLRLEGDFTSGDVPFYDAPFIDMRGIPALRYQGEDVVVAELEARWDVTPRWSLVGFVGNGWAGDSLGDLGNSANVSAGGAGFRYLIARRLGMRVGLDVARGPEDTVVYMGVGSSWN
jgi:hypothetical protein